MGDCVYEELTRKMNAQERTFLSGIAADTVPFVTIGGTLKWVVLWTVGIVLCGLAATALVSLGANPVVGGLIGGALFMAATVCLYAIIALVSGHIHWSRLHNDFIQRGIPEIQAALEDGNVFVKKVSATAVVEIIPFEDEGSGHIYDVGDGKVLFLKGQSFCPVNEEMSWPNTEFEIVRTVHGERWIGIFCSGQELVPIQEILTSECVDDIVWSVHEELLDGNIHEFARSITKSER